ncbi:MAG: hypothetical protein KJ571_08200 [Bacteroidetes bacterium]|nr:hypothetical protein [Bacteroidota bacterium]
MKKVIIAIIVFTSAVCAQTMPKGYELGGSTLKKTNDETPAGNTIEDILAIGDTIWLATGEGLSRSLDNGVTWTNYYNTEAFGTESVATVAYNNGAIWASTWHLSKDVEGAFEGSGLRYSLDNGETWTIVPQPLDEPGDTLVTYGNNILYAEAETKAGDNLIRDIDFLNNTIFIADHAGGFRKSSNMGQTWQRVVVPPDYLDSIKPTDTLNFRMQPKRKNEPEHHLNYIAYSLEITNDGVIFAGTAGGINKSDDGGISWVKFNHTNQANSISGNHIIEMNYNEFDKSLWATTWKAEGQTEYWAVSRTTNGGNNWEVFLPGFRAHEFDFISYGDGPSQVIVASEEGVYRSYNDGILWLTAPQIFDSITKVKLASNNFRSIEIQEGESENNIWVGSNSNGMGRITEQQGASAWDGLWKVFLASEKLTDPSSTKAFPNPFSPSQEKIKIQFSTNNTDAEISIRIFDFGMNLVKTLLQNAPRTSAFDEYFEFWDGRNEKGKVVPNGVYFYRIDIGNNDPLFGKIMILN